MIAPFLYVIGCAGAASLLSRRRFEEVLPLALMGSAFALYGSGLIFGSLWPGYVLCVLFALLLPVSLCALAVREWRARRGAGLQGRKLSVEGCALGAAAQAQAGASTLPSALRQALSRIVTPAFAIFCVLGAVVFLLDWNKGFQMWDEYSHWGSMVRETLRLDALYTSPVARDFVHPDYPPLVCLFETLWCKLAGGYREAYLYRGLHVLSFSLFFPALSRLRWPDWQRGLRGAQDAEKRRGERGKLIGFTLTCVGLLALLVTVPLCVELEDGGFYSTIYLDCMLGLLLAYGVFLVLDAKRWGAFELARLGVALSFLLLTKQMGIAFYALILGVLAVDFFLTRRACLQSIGAGRGGLQSIPRAWWQKGAGAAGALVVLPLLLSKLWSWHVDAMGLAQQFNLSGIDWAQVLASARGEGELGWKQQVLASYFEALGSYRIVVWNKLHVPYWALILVFAALLLVVAWAGDKWLAKSGKRLFARGQALACTALLLGGGAAYAFAMLLTYLTGFSKVESMRLASFPRYLGTYPFAVAVLFGMVLLRALCAVCAQNAGRFAGELESADGARGKQTFAKTRAHGTAYWGVALAAWGMVAFLWAFCMPAEQVKQITPARVYSSAADVVDEIVRETQGRTPLEASVFVLSQYDAIANDVLFYNVMLQYRMPERGVAFDYVDLNVPPDQYGAQAQKLADTLADYDYLYLSNVDERCTQVYKPLLNGAQAADRQIYQVARGAGGNVTLAPIA